MRIRNYGKLETSMGEEERRGVRDRGKKNRDHANVRNRERKKLRGRERYGASERARRKKKFRGRWREREKE